MQAVAHVTIEKTAKKFKLQSLLSGLLIIVSFILIANGGKSQTYAGVGVLTFLVGATWYIVNRIRIWWNHS